MKSFVIYDEINKSAFLTIENFIKSGIINSLNNQ